MHRLQDYDNWMKKKKIGWNIQITINALKFNRNQVDMPIICQSIRIQSTSKPKLSLQAKVILIYFLNKFYKGVPWETGYSIELSQAFEGKKIFFKWKSKQ
jgi:hypothetical protein